MFIIQKANLAQFIKMTSHYKTFGYNINVLQQTVCLDSTLLASLIAQPFKHILWC